MIAYGHRCIRCNRTFFDKESLVKYSRQIDNTCQNRPLSVNKKSAASADYLLMNSNPDWYLRPNDLHYAACTGNVQLVAKLIVMPNWCKMSCPTSQANLTVAVQNSKHRCTALLSADITIALSFCSVNHKESQTLLIPSTEELRFTLFAGRDMQIVLSCFSVTEVTYIFVTTMGIRQ